MRGLVSMRTLLSIAFAHLSDLSVCSVHILGAVSESALAVPETGAPRPWVNSAIGTHTILIGDEDMSANDVDRMARTVMHQSDGTSPIPLRLAGPFLAALCTVLRDVFAALENTHPAHSAHSAQPCTPPTRLWTSSS